MGSTSQPSQSGPPLETLSIKQLLRLHPRDRLLVRPLEWTGRHLEVLQCSFEDSRPPSPSQEHLDEVDGILSMKCLLRRKALDFHFDGRWVCRLPCQLFTSRYGNKAAFEKGMGPIALAYIDRAHIAFLRYQYMLRYQGRRYSKETMAIHERHVKRVTPPNRLHDPYIVALLLAIAYNQRRQAASSIWSRATFWPQVVVIDRPDEKVHLFAAHISSNYLNKFDFPSRRPAKSAQQPLLIHHIRVPVKPYMTFRRRLLTILLHPADYYKQDQPTD
ncbi:hypothetical protein V8C34DRAFT_313821 [Trichoderma compactum]